MDPRPDTSCNIRPETSRDVRAIYDVNCAAFGGGDEADLVDALRRCEAWVPELSLVAVRNGQVVGHILLTRVEIECPNERVAALALAPMAVKPDVQRRGIGSLLVQRALADAARAGHALVVVLGHAKYYPRFGFVPASRLGIRSPFDAPDEAFMARWLEGSSLRVLDGTVRYAPPFDLFG